MHTTSNTLNYPPKATRAFSKVSALGDDPVPALEAEKRWHRITAVERLGELIESVRFIDGVAQLAA